MVGNNRGGKYLVADLNDNASMPYLRAVSVLRVYHEVQMILHVPLLRRLSTPNPGFRSGPGFLGAAAMPFRFLPGSGCPMSSSRTIPLIPLTNIFLKRSELLRHRDDAIACSMQLRAPALSQIMVYI